jgi:protein-L-isoaspartate(D-aspartate) O-methyltransferase
LAQLVHELHSIERIKPLLDKAKARARSLKINNVHFYHSDGGLGYAQAGPFEAILSAAAPRIVPESLKQQLAIGGRLVIPVGDVNEQHLVMIDRTEDGFIEKKVEPVKFVPLLPGKSS